MKKNSNLVLRSYHSDDLAAIITLFKQTVHAVNRTDYTQQVCDAWAPDDLNTGRWREWLEREHARVAFVDNKLVGFCSIDDSGELTHLYVHKHYQRQGIAQALFDDCLVWATQQGLKTLVTFSSSSARPFFEKNGFQFSEKNSVERRGVVIENIKMIKELK